MQILEIKSKKEISTVDNKSVEKTVSTKTLFCNMSSTSGDITTTGNKVTINIFTPKELNIEVTASAINQILSGLEESLKQLIVYADGTNGETTEQELLEEEEEYNKELAKQQANYEEYLKTKE